MSGLAWVAEVAELLMPSDLPATTRLSAGYSRARERSGAHQDLCV